MIAPELPGALALAGLAALGVTVVCLLAALVTATAALIRRGRQPLTDARRRARDDRALLRLARRTAP